MRRRIEVSRSRSGEPPLAPGWRDIAGLGEVLADPAVTDVLIAGPGAIRVERDGLLEQVGHIGTMDLERLIEALLGPNGRRVDRLHPIADVRIDDRTRCNVTIAPVAVNGPSVALRRFPVEPRRLRDFGDPATSRRLLRALAAHENVLVIGGTGAGKTSLLGALLAEVPDHERVVVVEETAELAIDHGHVVRLEAQPPNLDGRGGVGFAQLTRAALRMRPDRLVVGEVRGVEAVDLLHAFAVGHLGCFGTLHGRGVEEALWRLADLARAGGLAGDAEGQVRRVVDLVVRMERSDAGRRQVAELVEVTDAP